MTAVDGIKPLSEALETQFKLKFTVSFMLPTSSSSWKTCMEGKAKSDVITVNCEVKL